VTAGPVDLVCAIDLGGEKALVDRRKALVRDLLSLLETEYPAPELVRVSVIGCVDHVFKPGREKTPVLRGDPLAPIAAARKTLRALGGAEISNVNAAPLEELLNEAAVQLRPGRGQGRAARVLLIGDRPPHPYPQKWANACPRGIRWEDRLHELTQDCEARCVAVTDTFHPRGHLADVWRRLGGTALRVADTISARQIGEDLGLISQGGQRVGIPLTDIQ
jgi:hypothetical protein